MRFWFMSIQDSMVNKRGYAELREPRADAQVSNEKRLDDGSQPTLEASDPPTM